MTTTTTFSGGVYATTVPRGRATATITLGVTGIDAQTDGGARFTVSYAEAQLELAGTGATVMFCHNADRSTSIFSAETSFHHALAYNGLEPELAAQAETLLKNATKKRWQGRSTLWACLAVLALVLVSLPTIFGWLVNRTVAAMPTSVDVKIGAVAAESIAAESEILERRVVDEALATILSRLRESVPRAFGDWNFRVRTIEEDSINAFALPGGQIFFHSGLLRRAESADEVAGVMAHEMAHVLERHGLRRIGQSVGIIAGVGLLMGDTGLLAGAATEYLTRATINSYSRDDESAADAIAVEIMHRAGLAPEALGSMFERMKNEGAELPALLHWVSTHPTHDARIAAIEKLVRTLPDLPARPLSIDWQAVREALQK